MGTDGVKEARAPSLAHVRRMNRQLLQMKTDVQLNGGSKAKWLTWLVSGHP
jgi:hypothetical protein